MSSESCLSSMSCRQCFVCWVTYFCLSSISVCPCWIIGLLRFEYVCVCGVYLSVECVCCLSVKFVRLSGMVLNFQSLVEGSGNVMYICSKTDRQFPYWTTQKLVFSYVWLAIYLSVCFAKPNKRNLAFSQISYEREISFVSQNWSLWNKRNFREENGGFACFIVLRNKSNEFRLSPRPESS
jgi:hypothetical protein